MSQAPRVTTLLQAASGGDADAQQRLFDQAYGELKRIARSALRRGAAAQVALNPTTLVHEAYLKIARGADAQLKDSTHFYSLFARAMRQVLVDVARSDARVKHGGEQRRVELTERLADEARPIEELLQIDAALSGLEQLDAELAELVEWHFFGGLSFTEIALARGVNERTVRRHWEMARVLLLDRMRDHPGAEG
jgi:RNA polymerase sigma factor (TIGR02999 family)